MATVEKIEEKLLSLINQKDSFAIALKGEWGIGKTHFWKSFYKNNHDKFKIGKYSYVSLFGIDSLESFKYQIAINTHDTNQEKDDLSPLKKTFSYLIEKIDFPKLESKGFSLSITQSMINNLISDSIDNTVICIDDFERKSDKLDTREIMGIVNFLKKEKKCKIIMILHEDKSRDLEVFREYREKVLDEVLILDNNLPIIRELINDDEIFNIYEDFYQKLGIKNLRFYMKVNKDYKSIISLNSELNLISKRSILENILVIRMVLEKGEIKLKTEEGEEFSVDMNFLLSFNHESDHYRAEAFSDYLNGFSYFYGLDEWGKFLLQNFTEYEINNDILKELRERDLISEEKIQEDNEFNQILDEYYSLKVKENFTGRLYQIIINRSKRMEIDSAYFFYNLIKYADPIKAQNLKREIENNIDNFLKQNINNDTKASDFIPFKTRDDDIFIDFLENRIEKYKKIHKSENIITLLTTSYNDSHINQNINLDSISKEELRDLIRVDLDNKRYRRRFIAYILHSNFYKTEHEKIRQWTVEILREEVNNNPDSKAPIEMWLNDTNELRKLEEYWKE